MQKVLIINGNPKEESYCSSLADSYQRGALTKIDKVRRIDIGKLKFDPNLKEGYGVVMPLEKDLVDAQQDVLWADHIVLIYPVWWGYLPGVTKGFFDRIFLPRFSYAYRKQPKWEKMFQDKDVKSSFLWDGLLKGKTGRIISTSGGPGWYYTWILAGAPNSIIKRLLFEFCGIKAKATHIGWIERSRRRREGWLKKVRKLGEKLK